MHLQEGDGIKVQKLLIDIFRHGLIRNTLQPCVFEMVFYSA